MVVGQYALYHKLNLICKGIHMTENEAKEIIKNDPDGNITKRLEALRIARQILGENCSMQQIWAWIEDKNNN